MKPAYHQTGFSVVLIVLGVLGVLLFVTALYLFTRGTVISSGVDTSQVENYQRTIDSANKLKQKVEQPQLPNTE